MNPDEDIAQFHDELWDLGLKLEVDISVDPEAGIKLTWLTRCAEPWEERVQFRSLPDAPEGRRQPTGDNCA